MDATAAPDSRILKRRVGDVTPNLVDYDAACLTFTCDAARRELDGLPGGRGINIAHEAVDRQAARARRDHVALRWLGKRDWSAEYTYGQLSVLANRFANALRGGVGKGDRVYALTGRIRSSELADSGGGS